MRIRDPYLDYTGRSDRLSGGAAMIPITTPKGTFRVWTKRVGNNPSVKVLLLHGGPGATHEGFEAFDSYLPAAGIEYYYYDQLGSAYSDQPDDPDLWELDRFVDEVEQVRVALGLDRSNFFLFGQSWGGILAMEYALHHGDALKGLVISNMMSSCRAYNAYAENVLMPAMDQAALAEIKDFEARGDTPIPGTWSSSSSTTTSSTCCACRSPSGPSPSCGCSGGSTRPSTSPCRDRASSG